MINRRKLAPLALFLSLAAFFTAGGLYIIRQQVDLSFKTCLAFIPAGIAIAILLDPDRARKFLTGRQARYGSNTLITSLAFIGILIAVNYLGHQLTHRWDVTQSKEHTLSKETTLLLDNLKVPVTVQAFFSSHIPVDSAETLLDSYKFASHGKFDYKVINPEKDPVAARNLNITKDGTIVFQTGNQKTEVTYASEQDFTSALMKITNPGTHALYFLTGHGEYDPQGGGSDYSYTSVHNALQRKNYLVYNLNLVTNPKIPEDALAIIIAGPRKPLSQPEIDLLKSYVNKGGSLVVLTEPRPFTDYGTQKDLLAGFLNTQWGIQINEDVIIDPAAKGRLDAIANFYEDHPITQKLKGIVTVFPTARSISHSTNPDTYQEIDLIKTSPTTWSETDYSKVLDNTYLTSPQSGQKGPLVIATAVTSKQNKSRLVVIGDADFASDNNFSTYGNGDLLINTIDWAASQESQLNITLKSPVQRLMIPPKPNTLNIILLTTVFLIPGAVIFSGVVTWTQRRKRG
jgi:ABC-type uncharacterized transport system involved in gliding motility auxiliary subunit